MSNTSRNKNLIFLVAVLLLTNIAVLAYFLWFNKPEIKKTHPDRTGMFIEMLQKEVGFTDAQVEEYKKLKDQRKETGKPLFDEMRKAKENLFKLMSDPTASDSTIEAAANQIAVQQKALDIQTLNHFKKIRALCSSADQQVKYDSAVLQMFRKMGRPPKRMEQGKESK
ncbi:MAG TPA: periplasmic heavy metal sensor [Chitinophagaceae bacterium]